MLRFALFLMPFFQIQTTATNPLVGNWVNQDSSSDGFTEIAINDREKGHLQVHVWGSCEPRDCDWGVTDVSAKNRVATSVFDQGFSTTAMEFIPLPDGRLLLVDKVEYKDQSPPGKRDHVEFFVRKDQAGPDAESIAAKALLKKVAEAYRTISAAQFEAEQFDESSSQHSAWRMTVLSKIIVSESGKFRAEESGSIEPKVLISDGKTVWRFFPESNEYNAMPAGKQAYAPYINSYI